LLSFELENSELLKSRKGMKLCWRFVVDTYNTYDEVSKTPPIHDTLAGAQDTIRGAQLPGDHRGIAESRRHAVPPSASRKDPVGWRVHPQSSIWRYPHMVAKASTRQFGHVPQTHASRGLNSAFTDLGRQICHGDIQARELIGDEEMIY